MSRCKYVAVSVMYERTEWLNRELNEQRGGGLTCSDNPLDFNAGGVQLLGKLMDSPVGVFVGFRVNVGFGAWKFNCRKVRGLLLWLNMPHAPAGTRIQRAAIQKELLSSRRPVKRLFSGENPSQSKVWVTRARWVYEAVGYLSPPAAHTTSRNHFSPLYPLLMLGGLHMISLLSSLLLKV